MGWSISPNTGLASIGQNGLLTYQQHTSDTVYTISYSDDDCAGATKSVTIKKCSPVCDCSSLVVSGKLNISKDGGSDITIGTLSKASCMSNARASSSISWLSNLSVSGNDIKATVEANSSSSSRTGSVTVTVDKEGGGTCDRTMNIAQNAGGGGSGKTYTITFGLYFENDPVGIDALTNAAVYSVRGVKVNYIDLNGHEQSFEIARAFDIGQYVSFRKDDFLNDAEALKTTTYTFADMESIKSIEIGNIFAVGQGVNKINDEYQTWGGDFMCDMYPMEPRTSYMFKCYSTICNSNSSVNARGDYSYDDNEIKIYFSVESINWVPLSPPPTEG